MKYLVLNGDFNFETQDMPYFRNTFSREITNGKNELNLTIPTLPPGSYTIPENISKGEQSKTAENREETINVEEPKNLNIPPKFSNRNATMCWLNSIVQFILLTVSENGQNSHLNQILVNYTLNTNIIQSSYNLRQELALKVGDLRVGQQDPFDLFVALQQFPNSDQEAVLTLLSIYTKNVMMCNRDSSHQSVGHTAEPEPFITVEIPTDNMYIESSCYRTSIS